jgi:hypothetical protein
MTSHRMMLFRGFILFLLCLVAEDRCVVIADPFPERRRTADFGVRDELGLIERARFEADGANKQGSPALRELREELLERRAAIARDPFGVARQCEPDRVFRQEYRHLLAAFDGRASDEERDQDTLGILETRGEVDHNLG